MVQELLRKYARTRVSPRCSLEIDLHKAFDSIEWCFIQWMLEATRFPFLFVKWIMECISTNSFSIIVNGNIHGHFVGKRGVRHGEPLSPYIFVLGMEYFSRMLKSLEALAGFAYHPSCHRSRLSHLIFADDIMLFCRGDSNSIQVLSNLLLDFS